MSLTFPPSFPSWVHGRGESLLVKGPQEFAALDPAQWADHPNDFDQAAPGFDLADPANVTAPVVPVVDETPAQIVDDPLIEVAPVEPPDAAPVPDVPVKRGPGRPRKVQA